MLFGHYLESYFEKRCQKWIKQNYTKRIWILLVESFLFVIEFTRKLDVLFIYDGHLNFSQSLHKVNRIMSYILTVWPHTHNSAVIQKIDESSSLHGKQRHSADPMAPQRMHLPRSCSSSSSSLPVVLLDALVLLPRHSLHISRLFPGPYDVPSRPEFGQEKG